MDFCVDCCLSNCKEHLIYCFQTCKDDMCTRKCDELSDICQSNCTEVPSASFSFMHKCIEKNGCGEYPLFDKECVKRKKEEIKACYGDFCSPLNKQKCIEDGKILYKNLFLSLNLKQKKEIEGEKKGVNILAIFLVIVFCLIILKMIFSAK